MQSSDVIIAGGGLMGLCSAYYLARQGLSVCLLEAGPVGREASWAGGGILWPLYAWRYPSPVQAMAQYGRTLFPGLCDHLRETTGIDPQYRKCGLLIGDSPQVGEQTRIQAQQWCAGQHERSEIIDNANGLHAGMPLQNSLVHLLDVAQVRNPRLCKALAAWLAASGVQVHEHEAVTSVKTTGGVFQGMYSKRAFYPARVGVVAAGAWSSQLVASARLFPVKGQMLLLRGKPGLLPHILLRDGRYAIPRADGYVLVGSTVEHAGFDRQTDTATQTKLQAWASQCVPALAGLPVDRHWAGLRPATEDGVPWVGQVPGSSGLYINAGHYRNGVVTAPASARLIVDLITGGSDTATALDADAYSMVGR